MEKISNAPDHEYNSEGLTVEDVVARLAQTPANCRFYVETAGDDDDPEGQIIGQVVEIQWGRDGHVYLRVDRSTREVRNTFNELER